MKHNKHNDNRSFTLVAAFARLAPAVLCVGLLAGTSSSAVAAQSSDPADLRAHPPLDLKIDQATSSANCADANTTSLLYKPRNLVYKTLATGLSGYGGTHGLHVVGRLLPTTNLAATGGWSDTAVPGRSLVTGLEAVWMTAPTRLDDLRIPAKQPTPRSGCLVPLH